MADDKLTIDDMSDERPPGGARRKGEFGHGGASARPGKKCGRRLVDIGLKMEGLIPKAEFPDFEKSLPFKEGESIQVLVRQIEGHDNYHRISWRAAREMSAWDTLFAAFKGRRPWKPRSSKK